MKQLTAGLDALNLRLAEPEQNKILEFLHLLQKWNQHYNLTGIKDLPAMINYHVLDSLTLAPFIQGESILDFGTGAGFPGVPLSIYFSQKKWCLLDSNGKKIQFLVYAKAQLHLENVEVIHHRAEKWETLLQFDSIVVRAVESSIQKIIETTQNLLRPDGQWLIMKSGPCEETLKNGFSVQSYPVHIPGVAAKRYIIVVRKPADENVSF